VTNPFKGRQYHREVILPGSGLASKVSLRPAITVSNMNKNISVKPGCLFLLEAHLSAYSSYSAITKWPRRCRFGCCHLEFLLGRLRPVRDSIPKGTSIREAHYLLAPFMQSMSPFRRLANLLLYLGRWIILSRK
jgi:hypothetical protein